MGGILMSLMDWVFEQSRKPTGFWGALMGKLMNLFHVPFYRLVLKQVPIEEDNRVLDIGCGAGKCLSMLAEKTPRGKAYGLDYSPDMVLMAKKVNCRLVKDGRVEVIQGSVSDMPFEDSFFNLVVACETIHFWPDLPEDLLEVSRILKPGGYFLVLNKYARNEKEAEKLKKYFALHSPDDFQSSLEGAGFQVEKLELIKSKGQIVIVGRKPER